MKDLTQSVLILVKEGDHIRLCEEVNWILRLSLRSEMKEKKVKSEKR